MKTIAVIIPMAFLIACGGGGGYSGSVPEPTLQLKSASVPVNSNEAQAETREEDNTPPTYTNPTIPTPEETKERAERRVQEAIEERRYTPSPWEDTYYYEALTSAQESLQEAINYGYEEDDPYRVQVLKNKIAKFTEIKRLYGKWTETGDRKFKDEIDEIYNSPYRDDWQEEFGYVDSPEQTEDLRKYNSINYQHLAFNEWLEDHPDLKRDYYVNADTNKRIGVHDGRTKYLPTSNLTYTGKYLGFSKKENLDVKGDLTARIKGESYNHIDFLFKGLNGFLKIDNLLEHEHYDFATIAYDENGMNPYYDEIPNIKGGSLTDSDITIEGKITTGPIVNGKTQSSGSIMGRIISDDRNLRLEAIILGNNHDGIVGHINRGAGNDGNLEIRFGAEKD